MADMDDAVDFTGSGLFHKYLMCICRLCFMCEAIAMASADVMLLSGLCDLSLATKDIPSLRGAFSVGAILGSYVCGSLSDVIGRQVLIPFTLLFIFCGTISAAFSQLYTVILTSLWFLGVGISGNLVVTSLYVAEFQRKNNRGSALVSLDIVWALFYCISIGFCYLVIPSEYTFHRGGSNDFRFKSWRVFVAMGGMPSVLVACTFAVVPESPRFLLAKRKDAPALEVLKKMFALNTGSHSQSYPLSSLTNFVEPVSDEEDDPMEMNTGHHCRTCRLITRRTFALCRYKSNALVYLTKVGAYLGYTWASAWYVMSGPDKNVEITYFPENTVPKNATSCLMRIDNAFYVSRLNLVCCLIVVYFVLFYIVDIVQRRYILMTLLTVGGILTSTMNYVTDSWIERIVGMVAAACAAGAMTVSSVILLERFPTKIRGTGTGLALSNAILVGFAINISFVSNIRVLLIAVPTVLIASALMCLLLPRTTREPMKERQN